MTLIDCLPEPILLLDRGGRVTGANRKAESLFGGADRLLGRKLSALFALEPREADALVGLWAGSSHPRPARLTCQSRTGAADFIAYGAYVRLGPEGPRRVVVRLVARREAVRDFINLRQRIGWLSVRLARERRMKEAAEQAHRRELAANRARDRFLAMMSHELRTPLNAILGFAEIMRDRHMRNPTLEAYAAYAAHIHRSGSHLLELVDSILQLAAIEEGRLEPAFGKVDGRALMRTCLRDVMPMAKQGRVTLESRPAPGRWFLHGDPGMLRQILINLLTNAIKYSPGGGKVRLRARRTSDGIVLSVIDRGPGIDRAEIEAVLRPFERLKNPIVSGQQGVGLGLAIVDRFARANGCRFALWSRPGLGTVASLFCERGGLQRQTSSG